jgi:hypothetical protein
MSKSDEIFVARRRGVVRSGIGDSEAVVARLSLAHEANLIYCNKRNAGEFFEQNRPGQAYFAAANVEGMAPKIPRRERLAFAYHDLLISRGR